MKLKYHIITLALLSYTQVTPDLSYVQKKTPLTTHVIATIINTRIGFHISRYIARIRDYTSFTFHQIARDQEQQNLKTAKSNNICIQWDQSDKIVTIHDGKQTPLIFGSIPTKPQHLDRLKTSFQSNARSGKKIGIYSLNKCWECQTSGLFNLIQNNPETQHYRYPTADMYAPSFIDILRAVNDLENRDNCGYYVSLVHCKAGRGRSATIVGAYLMHIMHKMHLHTTPDEIEAYLCAHRPEVHLGVAQKEALHHFWAELQTAKTFDNLYQKYIPAIQQRTQEIKKLQKQTIF